MSTRSSFPRTWLLLATIAACVSATSTQATESGPEAARLEAFTKADGTNHFALSLRPDAAVSAEPGPRDVVVVFDTSASQMGQYREKALSALEALLAKLDAADRVQLLAVDLDAVALTDQFVAPHSEAMGSALSKLRARTPLGSTDMEVALQAVAARFESGSRARVVVYLGQGRSPANILSPATFEGIVRKLVAQRVSVSSYAVGPRLDLQLLGVLANHTGGQVIREAIDIEASQAGLDLAQSVRATVYWPGDVRWPDNVSEVFPKTMPPLRSDRDSVVVGSLKALEPLALTITATTATGRESRMSWNVAASISNPDNCYLAQLVSMSKADGGFSLPTVGSATLDEAKAQSYLGARGLTQLACQAMSAGNAVDALRLAEEALRRDPENPEAQAVRRVASRQQGKTDKMAPEPAAPAADLNLVGPAVTPADAVPQDGAAVAAFDISRRQIAQQIQADVQATLEQARRQMQSNPAASVQSLKLLLENLRQVRDLAPDVQSQLIDVVQASLREADRRQAEMEVRRQRQLETQATQREQQLLADSLLRKQEKVRQLMDRFNALMDENRYRWAEEATAMEAEKVDPGNPVAVSATVYSRIKGTWYDATVTRIAKEKAWIDAAYEVEKSAVPFAGDPPIIYPDGEVWRELTQRRKEKYKSVDLASRGPAERKIEDQLKSPTTLEFIETPFTDVVEYLKDLHGIEIQLDKKALDDVGVAADTPITRNLKGISLRSALRLLLRELQLTYIIQDEVLLITTQEQADTRPNTKVYPVADLVLPIRTPSFSGGFGGLGGMSGGMGSTSGFGGGGGMGGGMGGGGMGGGGFGGGGMFNLRDAIGRGMLENLPKGGFQAFAVKDDLSAAPATIKADKPVIRRIQVEVPEGADANAVWDEYFAKHEESPASIREAVRRLHEDKKFAQVTALILAALRHGQGQPWMYEALALAMQLEGRPSEEVERAIMSAADFAASPDDLMSLAVYLFKNQMHRRALKVFRQVSALDPVRPEPYLCGLRSAQAVNDTEGVKWATLGICGHAWRNEHKEVFKHAWRVAEETLAQLQAAHKTAEAAAFQRDLQDAVQRDCVIVVHWTGDADIDLFVEEPSGTVCSHRNPLTLSGGVMLGDATSARQSVEADGGSTEVYVCPQGFSGTYKALIRRVWGKVTAGKVTVQIWVHYRGKNQLFQEKKISLDKGEAAVAFDLKDGRRQGSLKEYQVANAVDSQLAVNRQILGQELDSAVDARALASLSDSGSSGSGNFWYPGRTGAVGYQPVIITLPKGANFAATAVISADRRYVRVTSIPLFSGVSEVNIFNYYSGESSSTDNGTGFGGYGSN